ncbi:MAG: recombination mediator protein UvsY [Nitrosopumilaceae archaeon]
MKKRKNTSRYDCLEIEKQESEEKEQKPQNDYEKDLKINKYDLVNEFNNHPFLYMKYVKLATEADIEVRRLREKVDFIKAELYVRIREEREMAKEKVTETILDSLIKLDDNYQKAYEDYLVELENSKILSGAVEAFSQRKSGLENTVKLFLNNYYSHPVESNDENKRSLEQEGLQKLSRKKRRKTNDKKEK